jgi:hypothetical protein
MVPVRWVMSERITVESMADRTSITVSVQGRLAGIHRVLHVLGYRDTTTARRLRQEASSRADFRVAGVAAHFTGPHDADMT